jgi:hypothetical protein
MWVLSVRSRSHTPTPPARVANPSRVETCFNSFSAFFRWVISVAVPRKPVSSSFSFLTEVTERFTVK